MDAHIVMVKVPGLPGVDDPQHRKGRLFTVGYKVQFLTDSDLFKIKGK